MSRKPRLGGKSALVLACAALVSCSRSEGASRSAAPSATTPAATVLTVRSLVARWPRELRYLPVWHVFVDRDNTRLALQSGADFDDRCTYRLAKVASADIADRLRKENDKLRMPSADVIVHVANALSFGQMVTALDAAKSSGLRVHLSASFEPPKDVSPRDCVPSIGVFDGPDLIDPFHPAWALFGACAGFCDKRGSLDGRCEQQCFAKGVKLADDEPATAP